MDTGSGIEKNDGVGLGIYQKLHRCHGGNFSLGPGWTTAGLRTRCQRRYIVSKL